MNFRNKRKKHPKRNYRREYDRYFGVRGRPMTAAQRRHRKEKTSRNAARRMFKRKYGERYMRGKDVAHKNHNPLDNGNGNLKISSMKTNRNTKGKKL